MGLCLFVEGDWGNIYQIILNEECNYSVVIKNSKMDSTKKSISKNLPKWFKTLTELTLMPIILWPFMLLSACFVDSPNPSFGLQLISFIMVFFPFIIWFLFSLSRRLFFTQKRLAVSIPIVILSIYALTVLSFVILIYSS